MTQRSNHRADLLVRLAAVLASMRTVGAELHEKLQSSRLALDQAQRELNDAQTREREALADLKRAHQDGELELNDVVVQLREDTDPQVAHLLRQIDRLKNQGELAGSDGSEPSQAFANATTRAHTLAQRFCAAAA